MSMTTPAIAPDMNAPQQSALSRVVNVFIAPNKAFLGLDRKASSWVVAWLITAVVSFAYIAVIDKKVGFDKVTETQIKMNQKAQDRLDKLTPEQKQQQIDLSTKITKGATYASPVLVLVIFVVIAAVLLGTFNFGFGASIRFGTMLAVVVFAYLPNLLKAVISMITLLAGADPEGWNIKNPIATNLGFLVDQSHAALYSLATSIDIFSLWIVVLMGIGVASVSKIKRGTAIGTMFGWYIVVCVVSAGFAGIFG
jgi:hypothetical protein